MILLWYIFKKGWALVHIDVNKNNVQLSQLLIEAVLPCFFYLTLTGHFFKDYVVKDKNAVMAKDSI